MKVKNLIELLETSKPNKEVRIEDIAHRYKHIEVSVDDNGDILLAEGYGK